jgi:hypothetical protein
MNNNFLEPNTDNKIMDIPENMFIGITKKIKYIVLNNIQLIPIEYLNDSKCNYIKYSDIINEKYDMIILVDEINIYNLIDTVLIFYNFLKTYNDINDDHIKIYDYLDKMVKIKHNNARETSNNDEYRCASFIQYYLNLINEIIIKSKIDKYTNNDDIIIKINDYRKKSIIINFSIYNSNWIYRDSPFYSVLEMLP